MGREIRRVPAEFDWPIGKVWTGFVMPDSLDGVPCTACTYGLSPEAQRMSDEWYGYAPFDPTSTGSEPFTVETPGVRAFAERNVASAPHYYGDGEGAIVREAQRLADLWNSAWSHHLSQADVDALVAAGRLWDFTRVWTPEHGWQPHPDATHPTAAEVNAWAMRGMGHDGINASVALRARAEREGVRIECAVCDGHGSLEAYPGQRAEADAWERTPPPAGDWWQVWETVSEGSPYTPAFETPEELARHYATARGGSYEATLAWITGPGWAPSGTVSAGRIATADEIATGRG